MIDSRTKQAIEYPQTRWERFDALRKAYADIEGRRTGAYFVDWMAVFTPIERAVWNDIRCAGLPMLPQIPVGRRFVDFGDRERKIAIECDGAQFHDAEKDRDRDIELAALGWTVYRLPGDVCTRTIDIDDDELAMYNDGFRSIEEDGTPGIIKAWLHQTSEGFIEALAFLVYGRSAMYFTERDAESAVSKRLGAGWARP